MFALLPGREHEPPQSPSAGETGLRRPQIYGKSGGPATSYSGRIYGPPKSPATRECERHDRDVRIRANSIAGSRAQTLERSTAQRAWPPHAAMASESQRCAVSGFHVALLRRSTRARSPSYDVVHDPRRQASPLRRLLRRWTRNHGSRQSRCRRSRWPFDRPQHPASARTAIEPVHHAQPELSLPLLFYAQALVRTDGQGADYFSGRLWHHGRTLGNAHADANQQALPTSLDSDLRKEILGQGGQLAPHGPHRRH